MVLRLPEEPAETLPQTRVGPSRLLQHAESLFGRLEVPPHATRHERHAAGLTAQPDHGEQHVEFKVAVWHNQTFIMSSLARWPRWSSMVGIGCALSAAALVAQQPRQGQPPTFRSSVELVQVDVVVFDQAGQPVRGLKREDFTVLDVLDRRKPQAVNVFDEVNHDRDPVAATLFPPALTLDVADNQTAKATRIVAIVVDDLHIPTRIVDQTKALIRRLISELGPEATVGLIFTSGRRGVEMTEDRAFVYGEIDHLTGMATYGPADGRDSARALASTIEKAATMLGPEADRRKAFILISPGLENYDVSGLFDHMQSRPTGIAPQSRSGGGVPGAVNLETPAYMEDHTEDELLNMMASLHHANVATYAINPLAMEPIVDRELPGDRAIMTAGAPARNAGSPFAGSLPWNRPSQLSRDYLDMVASFSGGFAVTDPATFDAGVQMLLSDLDHYYMLGFYPADPGKGWRPLEVTVNRPDVFVRFRQGYELGKTPPPPKNPNLMAGYAARVLPKTDLALKMFATALPSVGKETRMAITLQVESDRASLSRADGALHDTLNILTMAVDLDKKKIVKAVKRQRLVTMRPRPDAEISNDITYQIVSEWSLPPGVYQLRTSADSVNSHKTGSVYLEVEVPDFQHSSVQLSGLVIGYADPKHHPVSATSVERSLFPLEPVLDRVFVPADVLRVYYDVWRKNPAVPATTTLEVVNQLDVVVKTIAGDVPAGATGRVDAQVPLSDLPLGPYRIRIAVADRSGKASRQVGFVIH
jgi:VWFA-related protein